MFSMESLLYPSWVREGTASVGCGEMVPVTTLLTNANVFASFVSIWYVPVSSMYTLLAVPISYVFDPSRRVVAVGVMFSMESLLYPSWVREGKASIGCGEMVPVTTLLTNANVFASFVSISYVPVSSMYTLLAVPISYVFDRSRRVGEVGVMFCMESLL